MEIEKTLVVAAKDIRKRTRALGREITRDYAKKELLVIGILNGAFIFAADLVREINLPLEIDFVRVSSYGTQTVSSGELKFSKGVELAVSGKDVLLVEDIVDTGLTIKRLRQYLAAFSPKSIKICALIDKKERRETEVSIDYIGFEVSQGFLVGYGLDCAEKYRNYPDIYHLRINTIE
ncbi:MAG: hypoxanthine phosphoribosyltransferase [Proteobacteria bacterium]|nr:hypoxanthine phosphoribosyltransferase [Pseudomonadota bacterium]MBU1708606.1 hypoxanthine phosphoribosyltransferase [Pseudomonadota bacterium]